MCISTMRFDHGAGGSVGIGDVGARADIAGSLANAILTRPASAHRNPVRRSRSPRAQREDRRIPRQPLRIPAEFRAAGTDRPNATQRVSRAGR